MKKKAARTARFNIVDLAAIVLIVAAALFAVWKLALSRTPEPQTPVTMHITVMAEGVSRDLYNSVQPYLPSKLMASGKILNGEIKSVEMRPYRVLGPDGQWAEDPDHVNLVFQVDNTFTAGSVLLSKVDEQEARIGRKDYTLKSEYIEFHNTTILDVKWEGWDNFTR